MSDQSRIEAEKTLPYGKEWSSPRCLARHWGRSVQHVLNLVESGEIRDNVDMRGAGARRSSTNIPRHAVVDFLLKRKT
jgi:hypothetical protein